ncbi:30S ribosomal protein S17 [bacterium]|nr:30S ribosomal protein S17 [bacterium]
MEERNRRKVRIGTVISDKMNKTITVKVERKVKHKIYKKYYKLSKKFLADDPDNRCKIGDMVAIMETRPLSKLKRWRLLRVIEEAK